jgi:predicted transcriptional regulator
MKITDFAVLVSKLEGGKINLKISQIKEVLKVANDLLGGELYKAIRKNKGN